MIELTRGKADTFLHGHVCARCYGDLDKAKIDGWDFYKNDIFVIVCQACGDAWGGACIRKGTAERMGADALANWHEAKRNLQEFFPRAERKSVKSTLQELGF